MGAAAVQVDSRNRYERTKEVGRMLTSGQLAQAIIREVKRQFARQESETNIFNVVPARASTSMEYEVRQTKAKIWNEGGTPETIDFPLEDGWRTSDGNPFGVPNGPKTTKDNPEALYLVRYPDRDFGGPVGLGDYWGDVYGRRDFFANDVGWSGVSGVALVSASVPLVAVPQEKLVEVADPKELMQQAQRLENAAQELVRRLGEVLTPEAHGRMIQPLLDEADFLRTLAGRIDSIRPKE